MRSWLAFVSLSVVACAHPQPQPQQPAAVAAAPDGPPVARKEAHVETWHGHTLSDDYFWLRKKGTPEVERYLNAENAYTAQVMKPTETFQEKLYQEMLARVQEDDVSVPYRNRGYYYYSRTATGLQYPILCRKSAKGADKNDLTGETAKAPEEITLDLNEIGKTAKFVGLGPHHVSDDSRWLAYSIDETGFRENTLRFKDLSTGKLAPESIEHVDAVAWAADSKTVFYVIEDKVLKRPYRLYRHVVGSDPATDALIYEEKDDKFDLFVTRTRSGLLVAIAGSMITSEVRILDSKTPLGEWRVVEPRQADHMYSVDRRGDTLFIRTNLGADGKKALNYRLVTAPISSPGRAHWRELIAHRPDVMLENVDVFASHIVLEERTDGLPRLRILDNKGSTDIPMPEALFAVFPDANPELDTPALRFHFQSPITPDRVYDWDFAKKTLTLRKQLQVKNYDPSLYTTTRAHATAKDGTKIPISLVYKKGVAKTHPNPMLLFGYGSYGFAMPLTFSSDRFSLLDRGVVFAVAHIRGGGEMGKAWHEGGRMRTKMNTFTDFIACAESLITDGWTARDRLVIYGGSAGGLLMGAVTNLRPDLWKGVLAKVPFVDVINTMLDETLPGTPPEFEEWGNPKNKEHFEWISAYSPYDNLVKKDYPAILVTSSYNDSQVMYWEPAKYVARLRTLKTDKNSLLLKMNMEPAGHGGQSGRYRRLHETAFDDAWILQQLGIKN
jgi:oligopeptidase B